MNLNHVERWMEKQNTGKRAKRKRDEYRRLRQLYENTGKLIHVLLHLKKRRRCKSSCGKKKKEEEERQKRRKKQN